VAAAIMGGSFASRLNRVLREERGWTYDVSATAHALRSGGWLQVATSTQTANVPALLEAAAAIVALEPHSFTEAEARDAVGHLVGIAPLSFSTAEAVTAHAAGLASHGLSPDRADAELRAVAKVTAAQAEAAWRDLMDPAAVSLIVLGDADALADPLDLTPEPLPEL
ncbi:MAG: insulinase family protein, partial [Propionibacteriaceae bacterium]|jgi:predicted Zn-dependent peptidase|nr:insulinase family protein [Propionibacteriaceae bacterium]